jgi:type IV pilus assembly protein PilV
MTRRPTQRGFTLVSVLIAMAMLSIGLMALARTQAALLSSQHDIENRDIATAIANSYLEALRGRDPATLVTEGAAPVNERGQTTPDGSFTRSTTISADGPHLLRTTVAVSYPRGPRPIQLITLIYRP